MDCVLLYFGLFPMHITISLGRNARIAPSLTGDTHSKIVSKSTKGNL